MVELALTVSTGTLIVATAVLALFSRARGSSSPLRAAVVAVAWLIAGLLATFDFGAAALTPAAVGVVVLLLPRHWHLSGSLFFASLLVAFVTYTIYLVRATFLLGGDPLGVVLGTLLLVFELAAMLLLVTSAFEMVDALAARAPELPALREPARWPVVCLQVPAYNEPTDLVIETLRSLAALDYPALRIQVIDNNTTEEELWRPVEAECQRLAAMDHEVEFVHLPTWPGYKAGALNWGLAHLADDVEIVGIVDADYVVDPRWLRATIPYFSEDPVAFVQTPQDYRAWEESGFYRACYAGFALFFKIGMRSRSRRNSIIFAGTMGLVRRSALEDVGGWDEQIITEDAEVSLRMLQCGWQAVYVPVAYGQGIMPLTYEGLRKQRFRWAFGGIQILRRHWRAILPWNRRSGLTLGQRYDHLMGGLWWFNDALTLAFSLFVFAAATGAIFDRPFVVQRLSGIGIVLPLAFVALNLGRYVWATKAATGAGLGLALGALRVNMSLSWIIALACLRGLTQERGVFLRTPKFQGAPAIRELRLVWVETTIAALALALLLGVVVRAGGSAVSLALAGLLAWSLLIYGSATSYALADPTRRPLTSALRQKALLELRPRLARAARARSTRVTAAAALAVMLVMVAVATESDRAPVADLPFREPLEPIVGGVADDADADDLLRSSPTAKPSPTATTSLTPTQDPVGGEVAGPADDPVGTGTPTPAATPAPAAPAPPAAAPTPTAAAPVPTAPPAAQPTQPVAVSTPAPTGRPSEQPTPPVAVPTPPPPGRP